MVIIHINGDRSIFLPFCDHQDTESESCEIEMSMYIPIFTHNKISNDIRYNGIHTLQYGRKIML